MSVENGITKGLIRGVFIVDNFKQVGVVEWEAVLEERNKVVLLLGGVVDDEMFLDDFLRMNIFKEFLINSLPSIRKRRCCCCC